MNGYTWAILLYAILLIGVGVVISKRVTGASDYFVGGENLVLHYYLLR